MNAELVATAEMLGLDTAERETDLNPPVCARNDGREGVSYLLQRLQAPPTEDIEGLLAQVRQRWEEQGCTVSDRGFGQAQGVTATTEVGAVLSVLSGPGGTVLSGETLCALEEGSPL